MRKFGYLVLAGGLIVLVTPATAEAGETLRAFRSDRQIERFLERNGAIDPPPPPMPSPPPMYVPPPPAPAPPAPSSVDDDGGISVTGTVVNQPSFESASPITAISAENVARTNITNTQEVGVDEGGIVKVHGRHLVVLRRGRLFTIDTADGGLRRVDQINAFPQGDADPDDAWYDEMLVSGDMVVVIGYSYGRMGTEINRFRIDPEGRLTYLDTHHIMSQDYYSDRNYASRLVGDRLVVYSPIPINMGDSWKDSLPAVRRWRGPSADANERTGFRRLARAHQIYMAEPLWNLRDERSIDTFHAVTICEATSPNFDCTGSAVVGSESRTFYVSQTAVYVWTSDIELPRRDDNVSFLYRLPLDGSPPQAIGAWGGPVDQFSFREDRRDGLLNVVVRADSGGDWMWRPEMSEGDAALLRIPLAAFGDGSSSVAKRAYRDLPAQGWRFYNRYVGQHLLYATGQSENEGLGLRAVPLDGGPVRWVALPHGVTRLDVIGADGVAIGQDSEGSLGFSAIGLNPRTGDAVREDTYLFPNAGEGENRSQAFFYRPDASDPSGTSGMMALPITRRLNGEAYRFLGSSSAIAFLNRQQRRLSPAGELTAQAERAVADNCIASCVDWYGNARPIFFGNRIFALMGYELVEGRMANGRITELRRLDFAPPPVPANER